MSRTKGETVTNTSHSADGRWKIENNTNLDPVVSEDAVIEYSWRLTYRYSRRRTIFRRVPRTMPNQCFLLPWLPGLRDEWVQDVAPIQGRRRVFRCDSRRGCSCASPN